MNFQEMEGYAELPTSVKTFLELPAYGTPEFDTALAAAQTAETAAGLLGQKLIVSQIFLFAEFEKAMQMAKSSDMSPDDLIRFQAAMMAAAVHNYVTKGSAVLTSTNAIGILSTAPPAPVGIAVPIPIGIS